MGSFSIWHWLVVLGIVLVLFGSNKVSSLMGEFGKGIKSFKQNIADDDSKKAADASMANSSLNAPLPEPAKTTTVNNG
ncbi:MAG: Sec-independent protein translocase TatA [Acidocella sp. 20-57-95]|nr:MAG: Sec-independent protein translocase TatA [Acidocella sp. 20-57-95]OYV58731.1 MAG: Sec-independent protein translocase TatA [Acidocella sp. 21-58-7]HQT63640.1 twin-arginine translocase TatA/TatE family subunit [Acidocella sp.]HQU04058.1 twin-arginine translocase TatA/TatE family subunit [Acidocella sp.]